MFTHPLEERCFVFGKRARDFCRRVKLDIGNIEDAKQLVRASGSVGANYIEANENLGKGNKELEGEKLWLIGEALELRKIFSTIIQKLQNQVGEVQI